MKKKGQAVELKGYIVILLLIVVVLGFVGYFFRHYISGWIENIWLG